MTVSSTANKVSYSGNGSLDTFAYTFKIFADSDLKVFIRTSAGTETLKTISTHYTVTNAGVATGGNVVFTSGNIPASGETVVIQRELTLTQGTDYVENDPFPAQSHEDALDRLTFVTQQMQEELDRSIKASVTNTITNSEFTVSATDRANKVFAFDASGNLSVTQELGTNRGDWAASTSYAVRDLVKDTSTGNIFFVNEAHTSSGSQPLTTNTNSSKYDLLIESLFSGVTAGTVSASKGVLVDGNKDITGFRNVTLSGDLTLGSGAVISEAELETIDGITPGTAAASKAMVLDASLDISGGRNLTISGELDAATLDVSGDVDIDGTLETDALSIASTAVTATAAELNILDGVTATAAELNYSDTGAAVGTVVASKVVTADANKDVASFRNITLTGELDAGSLDVSGDADIDGTLEADAMTLNGTAITATATLDTGISNNNVPKFTSGVADNDFLRVDGTAIEGRSAAEVLSDIAAAPAAGSSNIVTTGALNSGSITSGFGAIDNGASAITTTGVITGGTLEATADTSAGDNAAIGYTAAEGLILTGQGSTSDITLKNDADATVFTVPTGTDDILFPDNAKAMFGAGSDLQIYHDGSHSRIYDNGGGELKIMSNGTAVRIQKDDGENMILANTDGAVNIYYDGSAKLATTSTGVDVTGVITTDGMTTSADINFGDNDKAIFGAGSDLQIYHDGSNSYIVDNGTGDLVIQASDDLLLESTSGENYINCNNDGSVEVFYNGGKKFETTSSGIDITGGFAATAASTITTSDNSNNLTLTSTDADANTGPNLVMTRASGSPADNDAIGELTFNFNNDAAENTVGTRWRNFIIDASDGTEDAAFDIFSIKAGALTSIINYDASTLSFNDGSADIDFRVESDNNANALFVQGSSGNVGIGTASPAVASGTGAQIHNAASGAQTRLSLTNDSTGSASSDGLQLVVENGGGALIEQREAQHLGFATSASERARFDNGTNFFVGKTSDTSTGTGLTLSGSGFVRAVRNEVCGVFNRQGSDGTVVLFQRSDSGVGSISVTTSGTTYNTSSDRRLKSNIEDAASASDKIDAIQVRQFDWNVDDSHQDYGLIAQELQPIEPMAVSGDENSDEMMSVDYSKLVPMLIKEIQELRGRVAALEAN